MPYTGPVDPKLPSNVQKLPEPQRAKWVKTWNNTFNNCRNPNIGAAGSVESCEKIAFKIANGTIKKEVGVVENKETVEENCKHGIPKDKCIACVTGAVTFEEAELAMTAQEQTEEIQETTTLAEGLMMNVMRSEEIPVTEKPSALRKITDGLAKRLQSILPTKGKETTDKQVTKTEEGIEFKASDYAVVPDPEKPSTWKLRLAEKRSGDFTVAQVARAITAMQPSGFRGQRVQLTGDQKKQAVSRITSAINKTSGTDDQKENLRRRLNAVKNLKDSPMFQILKDKEGNMRWLGIPSNKWRDRDNPPQIIEEAAHKEFTDYLDNTKEYPVLLSWHTPGTRIGVADFADYSNGFLIMGGPIDKDKYAEAEKLAEKCQKEDIGMSHGFVYSYSDKEQEIIGKYRTWEVSHLPLAKAANVWTAIDILKKEVKQMSLNPEKRKYLVELHGEDVVSTFESKVIDLEGDLASLGIESKELGLPGEDTETVVQETIKALVESDGFKAMITAIQELTASNKELKETTIPGLVSRLDAVEAKGKETADKTQKTTDDIIAEAFRSKSSAFQASKDGDPPTEAEKEEERKTAVATPVDAGMVAGFFGQAPGS